MSKKEPVVMDAEWMATFRRELTPKVQSIALGYCDRLLGAYHQAEGIEDLRCGHDYVDGAILDTMQGVRTWNPERMPLYRHLCRVVYSRVYHDRHRLKRQRTRSYHELNLDDENSVEVAMSLKRDDERKRPDGAVMLKELHEKAWAWLRANAACRDDSADLIALVEALASGVAGEPAIRAITGWPEQRYKNAARRYATLVRAMPPELAASVLEAIVRAPRYTGNDWRKAKGTEVGASGEDDAEPETYDRDTNDVVDLDAEPSNDGEYEAA